MTVVWNDVIPTSQMLLSTRGDQTCQVQPFWPPSPIQPLSLEHQELRKAAGALGRTASPHPEAPPGGRDIAAH